MAGRAIRPIGSRGPVFTGTAVLRATRYGPPAARTAFPEEPPVPRAAGPKALDRAATGPAPASSGLGMDVVLPIRLGGTAPALFCVHPSSGMAWPFLGLADTLRPGRPVYGMQAPGLSGHEMPATIGEFATRYVREIRALQPAELIREQLGGVTLFDAETLERMVASHNASACIRSGYRRPVYDGDIVYFHATVEGPPFFGPYGWRPYITGLIHNHEIDVTHDELTAPDVLPIIARVLDEYLGDEA